MSSIWSSSSTSVLNTTIALPSQVTSITNACSLSYQSETSYLLDEISKKNVTHNSNLVISTPFSCSVSGSSAVTMVFSDGGVGNAIPSWGSVDQSANTLTFNVPSLTVDTDYTFLLKVTTTEIPTFVYYVTVKLYVVVCVVDHCNTCDPSSANFEKGIKIAN